MDMSPAIHYIDRRVKLYRSLDSEGFTVDSPIVPFSIGGLGFTHLEDCRLTIDKCLYEKQLHEGQKYIHAWIEGKLVEAYALHEIPPNHFITKGGNDLEVVDYLFTRGFTFLRSGIPLPLYFKSCLGFNNKLWVPY